MDFANDNLDAPSARSVLTSCIDAAAETCAAHHRFSFRGRESFPLLRSFPVRITGSARVIVHLGRLLSPPPAMFACSANHSCAAAQPCLPRPPPALLVTITGVHPIRLHDLGLFLNLKIQHNLFLLLSQPEGLPATFQPSLFPHPAGLYSSLSPSLRSPLSENHTTIQLSQTRCLRLKIPLISRNSVEGQHFRQSLFRFLLGS